MPLSIVGNKKPRVSTLPAFPPVARKLMALVAQENSNMQEVSRLIRSDAIFTGEVLRLANSAAIGLRYEVNNILHAISVLGIDRLRGLVLTVAMRDFFSTLKHDELLRRCWRHNLACAMISEWAAESLWLDKAAAYTGGLLHSLGHLAMCALYPEEYLEAHGDIDAESAATWLVKEWGLPEPLAALCRCHHSEAGVPSTLPGLIHIACQCSDMLGFSIVDQGQRWQPERFLQILPRLPELPEIIPYRVNAFEQEFLT